MTYVAGSGDDQWSDHGDGRDALWLSGQWGDESGGLFDCPGTAGPVVITVPVAVAANAANRR